MKIPVGPEFPNQMWGKSVHGFLSYGRTNKQTNRDYNFIYIDFYIINFFLSLPDHYISYLETTFKAENII